MERHETQPSERPASDGEGLNDLFADAQRIEGGGPHKKINMPTMPKVLRTFGYIVSLLFIALVLVLFISLIVQK